MQSRIALVITILLIGAVAPFATPAAAQSGSAVGFGNAETTTTQGDVATIELQLRNTKDALLRIHSADQQYRATVNVIDGNDDGTVRVRFNTFRGPNHDATAEFTTVDTEDTAELIAESSDQTGSVLDTGRYNLIASTATTSVAAVLYLKPPDDAGSNISVVAAGTPFSELKPPVNESSSQATADQKSGSLTADTYIPTAAVGDFVQMQFSAAGIGGAVESPPPASNLVFPTDSAPDAVTTHTVQVSPNKTVDMRSLTVDYGINNNPSPAKVYRLAQRDVHKIGIDKTGDGYIDHSVKFTVQNIRTSTDGRLTLTFDRPVTVSKGDTLLGVYKVQNSGIVGPQSVVTTLTGEAATYRKSGTVLYGPAGQGTLGHGIDLQIESVSGDAMPTAPLSALETTYDSNTGDISVKTNTSTLTTGEYKVRLQTKKSAPADLPQVDLTEGFKIVEPNAELTNHSISDDSKLSVTASTNLAPRNTVIVRVDAQEASGGISQVLNCVATVQPDGSTTCEFDLSESGTDLGIEVSIQRSDSVIVGPVRIN